MNKHELISQLNSLESQIRTVGDQRSSGFSGKGFRRRIRIRAEQAKSIFVELRNAFSVACDVVGVSHEDATESPPFEFEPHKNAVLWILQQVHLLLMSEKLAGLPERMEWKKRQRLSQDSLVARNDVAIAQAGHDYLITALLCCTTMLKGAMVYEEPFDPIEPQAASGLQ